MNQRDSYELRSSTKSTGHTRLGSNGSYTQIDLNPETLLDDENTQVSDGKTTTTSISVDPQPQYDVFVYSLNNDSPTTKTILTLQSEHQHLCCDSNCFIPGETLLDNFGNCLENSKKLIVVICKDLLFCPLSLFYMQMAICHVTQNKHYNIINVIDGTDGLELPKAISTFRNVSIKNKNWFPKLLSFVGGYGLSTQRHLCNVQGHVDISPFIGTNCTALSDPLPLRDIPKSLKAQNQIMFKRITAQSQHASDILEVLQTPLKCVNVEYSNNMDYFYRLKSEQKQACEAVADFKTKLTTIIEGDVVEIVDNQRRNRICAGDKLIIQTASGSRCKVPAKIIVPILCEFPSIAISRFYCPITVCENEEFKSTLKRHGYRIVKAKDTIQDADKKFKINQGDTLHVLEENDSWLRIKNYRGNIGWVQSATCEP